MKYREIKVAVYFSSVKRFAEEVKEAIEYSWTSGNTKYRIDVDIISKRDIINGKLRNYDALVIPGAARPYFDAYNKKWREEVMSFIENGGGYVGICGGANLVSMGFNEKFSPNSILNASVLKIVNVYVNDEQDEEWQYLWKSNWRHGGPPIKIYILKNEVPIFKGFYNSYRSIRYWGGPGMYDAGFNDEKLGKVIPLAIYAEETMEVAPLHFWKYENGEWIPYKNVTTDIKNQYAAIASIYGKGKIVLFGPHPERNTFFDGHVEEFPVRNGRLTWFIYNWVSNNASELSYNWWILRRSIAWICDADIPPASNIAAYIEEPKYGIYVNGREILYSQNTIVIGKMDIFGKVIGADEGILYIDGKKICNIKGDFHLSISLPFGKHVIKISAKNEGEEAWNEMEIFSI